MKDKKMMDIKNCETDKKEIHREEMQENAKVDSRSEMLESARKRLQWYATEASEEEFDEEEVAMLVGIVKKLEPQSAVESQDSEREMERFRAYVELYLEDEARRAGAVGVEYEKLDENVEPDAAKGSGKIISGLKRFRGKGLVVAAAAACILLVILIGTSGDVVNADEDTGFFHWLKWDEEGMMAITSPEKENVGAEENSVKEYANIEELPEEYHQFVIDKESISLLQEYEFKKFVCTEKQVSNKFTEVFWGQENKKEIQMGIVVYNDETIISLETLIGYELSDTEFCGEHRQDVFAKEGENGKMEYMVLFYDGNKKYFVYGDENVEFLKEVSAQYMDLIFNNN